MSEINKLEVINYENVRSALEIVLKNQADERGNFNIHLAFFRSRRYYEIPESP